MSEAASPCEMLVCLLSGVLQEIEQIFAIFLIRAVILCQCINDL